MRAINDHAADRHLPSEPRLQRRLDAQRDKARETRGAEVVEAAGDDEDQKSKKTDRAADEPSEASPHRALPLPLSRRSVMTPLGRTFFYIHSDSLTDVLTTSQKIEIAQVIAGRKHCERLADRRGDSER